MGDFRLEEVCASVARAYRGVPIVEHSGSLGAYRADILRYRDAHTSVAVLCNVSNVITGWIVRRVSDLVLADRLRGPSPSDKPPQGVVRSGLGGVYEGKELAAFAGDFYSEELESTFTFIVDGNRLKLRRGVQSQWLTLQEGQRDQFRLQGSTIRFRRGSDGKVIGLVVDADRARGLAFERRPQPETRAKSPLVDRNSYPLCRSRAASDRRAWNVSAPWASHM